MNIMAQSTMTADSISQATITVDTMGLSTASADSVGQPSTTVESIGLLSTPVDSISQSSADTNSQTSITVNNIGQSTSATDSSSQSSLPVYSMGQSSTTKDFDGQSCSTVYIMEPSFITKDFIVQVTSKGDITEPSTSVGIMKQSSSTTQPTSCLDSASTSLDTEILSGQVKNYLKVNQIRYGRFSELVLGVTPSRLSTLLNTPEPFNSLSRRVQAYYERMSLWMTTRATYGGNPYIKSKSLKKGKVVAPRKPRSFLDDDENLEMLNILKEYSNSKYMLHAESGEDINDQGLSSLQWQDDPSQKVIVECIPMETTNEEYEEVFTAQIAANQEIGLEEMCQINEKVGDGYNLVINPFGDQGDNRDGLQTEPNINSSPVQGSMMGNLEGNEK